MEPITRIYHEQHVLALTNTSQNASVSELINGGLYQLRWRFGASDYASYTTT